MHPAKILLPDMDGLAVLRSFQGSSPDSAVILHGIDLTSFRD